MMSGSDGILSQMEKRRGKRAEEREAVGLLFFIIFYLL
jgi:hypothetical protein